MLGLTAYILTAGLAYTLIVVCAVVAAVHVTQSVGRTEQYTTKRWRDIMANLAALKDSVAALSGKVDALIEKAKDSTSQADVDQVAADVTAISAKVDAAMAPPVP